MENEMTAPIKKSKIPRIAYNNPDELYRFFTENRPKVRDHISESIKYAITNKLENIELFELRYSMDSRNIIVLNMKKSNWKSCLQNIIDELVASEKLEDCIPLRDMMSQIEE